MVDPYYEPLPWFMIYFFIYYTGQPVYMITDASKGPALRKNQVHTYIMIS